MSDLTHTQTIRIIFDPYDHNQVQTLMKKVYRDFGNDKSRWYCTSPSPDNLGSNCWALDFVFQNPHDATMFGLKYLR